MIVWGGENLDGSFSDGYAYDPKENTWTTINSDGAPTARSYHTAVWTGSEMIVWGGYQQDAAVAAGGIYDPSTDSWRPLDEGLKNSPKPRIGHSVLWSGKEMIVWGGSDGHGKYLGDGFRYDIKKNRWRKISKKGSPDDRELHTALWTGEAMVIIGGTDSEDKSKDTAGIYNLKKNKWTSFTIPKGDRSMHSAVWTGEKILVWGGRQSTTVFVDGKLKGYSVSGDGLEVLGH
jgi:N-acetylneuraminic acid mutarotase